MKISVECPRCGSWRCEWTKQQLFCPCCLLTEWPEDYKYWDENPYEDLDPEHLELVEELEHEKEREDLITESFNERLLRHQHKPEEENEIEEDFEI